MISKSEAETREFGRAFALKLRGGDVICVEGTLGAGKSTFIRGIAEGLRIKRRVQSPTFTIMRLYRTPRTASPTPSTAQGIAFFVHVDTYRIKSARALAEIGLFDYIGRGDTVAAIEWPGKARPLLRGLKCIWVRLAHRGSDHRIIKVRSGVVK